MGLLRIFSNDPDRIQDALDSLKGVDVDVLTSETEEPAELVLFYLSRMNKKLDNLGQLKHLVKLERTVGELSKTVGAMHERDTKEIGANYRLNRRLYERLIEISDFDPKMDKYDLAYLTMDQIHDMFIYRVSFE
jgi:hypothetical protein